MTEYCIVERIPYETREMIHFKDGWVSLDGEWAYLNQRIQNDAGAVKAYIQENLEDYLLQYFLSVASNDEVLDALEHGYRGNFEMEKDYCEGANINGYFAEFLERYDRKEG